MFELEKAIEQWRADVRSDGIRDRAAIEELECHLREEFRALLGEMRAELAFELAAHRLGSSKEIRREFRKVEWCGAGVAWQVLMGLIAAFSAWVAVRFAEMIPHDAGEERTRMIVSAALIGVAAVVAAVLPRFLPQAGSVRGRLLAVWGPLVLIGTIVMLIGSAGHWFLGRAESETLRGIIVLIGVCLVLLSVSVGQLGGMGRRLAERPH